MEVIYLKEIRKFLKKLETSLTGQCILSITALTHSGPLLKMPYSKALGKGLFELRILGRVQVRILYCFHDDKAYLLHGLVKKNQKLSPKDIRLARELKRQIERL